MQELPLFEPPIDPALLIRAAASGVDLSSAIGDINAPLPYHRYLYLSLKAAELCQELKNLGNGILAALEKRDAGQLALLNSSQSMKLLDAVRDVKKSQVDDTAKGMEIINKNMAVVQQRWNYYNNTSLVNFFEGAYLAMEGAALVFALLDTGAQPVTAVINLFPDAKLGAPTSIGITFGGSNVGKSASKFAKFLQKTAIFASRGAGLAAALGSYTRRKAEYDLQFNIADNELKQLQSQLDSATIKNSIAQKELSNHDLQRSNAKDTDDFLHNKYTNVELYDWMLGQLSGTYFQTYQLVYDTAKRAERAFGYELGVDNPNFISFDYWDSMKKGLTAGEQLFYDLKRMDMAYMEQDVREYELTRSISLAQLDPVALVQLRSTGACFFNIPEAIYDLDYPGHYMRRIKSVSVTIPCVAGPYTSVASTLSLAGSSIRKSPNLSNGKYARVDNDIRFADVFGQMQSIATSSGTNDSGLFEGGPGGGGNMRDERYLPFERSGAISSWKMEVPMAFRSYDYDTITDVVLTIRYTAREGGSALGQQASAELRQKALDAIAIAESQNGLSRLFDVPREFPDVWYKFLRGTPPASGTPTTGNSPPVLNQEATLPFTTQRFPYLFFGGTITISKIDVFVRVKKEYLSTHSADTLTLTLEATPPPTSGGGTAPTPLALSEWSAGQTAPELGKVFQATKAFERPPGNYYLTGSLNGGTAMIDLEAIAQFLVVAHYRVKWS